MELQYIGECEHLDNYSGIKSLKCKKRYFNVFNPITGYYQKIAFCNDYLKLHMQRIEHYSCDISNMCRYELSKLIAKSMDLQDYTIRLHRGKQPVIKDISFVICDRPCVPVSVPFRLVVEWYLQNHSSALWYELKDAVVDFMHTNERYKKYKTVCNNLNSMLNKLKHIYHAQDEPLINDILLLILKIIYNETYKQQVPSTLPVRPNGKTRQARSNSGRSKSTSPLSEASEQCAEV